MSSDKECPTVIFQHVHITSISRLGRIYFISFTCMKGSWKVGMLQRGDSDIGWADLYIIPDRARFQIEKINFHPSRFYWIMVFLHPDSSTTLILTTSSTHASCSRSPLLFLSGRPSQPHFNLQFVFSFCLTIFVLPLFRCGLLPYSPLWLSTSPSPSSPNRIGARSPNLDSLTVNPKHMCFCLVFPLALRLIGIAQKFLFMFVGKISWWKILPAFTLGTLIGQSQVTFIIIVPITLNKYTFKRDWSLPCNLYKNCTPEKI